MADWLENIRLPFSLNEKVLGAAAAALVLGLVLVLGSQGRPLGAAAALTDATISGGDDYPNLYVPTQSTATAQMVGKRVLMARFGSGRDVIYQGTLTPADAFEARRYLLSTTHMAGREAGSPITAEAFQAVGWLKSQPGGRKGLLLFTDGLEQKTGAGRLPAPGWASGIEVLILFPRLAWPKVAEALRLSGARVRVVRDPAAAAVAIENMLTGTTPLQRWLRLPGWGLAALGCLLLPLSVRRRPEEVTGPSEPIRGPIGEPWAGILPPLPVVLTAQVESPAGPSLGVRKQMPCLQRELCPAGRGLPPLHGNGPGLLIAREGARGADLSLPLDLLGEATEVVAEVWPAGRSQVLVVNRGQVPLVVGEQCLDPGQGVEAPVDAVISLGPAARLRLGVEPALRGGE
jgi:hypothetical protein